MGLEAIKIVVIDDEKVILLGISTIMKHAGYQVFTAGSGVEGLDLIREHIPDLIISDVMMPPPDGLELKEILSKDLRTALIPFIFVTARTSQEDKITGLSSGADDYITKPFDKTELLARVQAVMRRVELGRQRGRLEAEGEMSKLRQEIMNNVTHELRTPVGILLNTLELSFKNRFDNPDEEKHFIMRALSNVHLLRGLIDDLLFLSNIDQGKHNSFRQVVDINFDIFEPAGFLLESYKNKNVDLKIDLEPDMKVNAPRHEFKRAVMHLLDNALKFSPTGGKVAVTGKQNGYGGCVISIQDEGPGISPVLREKVFERYYQVSQGDARLYGGLGVGLTIARETARSLGGEVSIRDSENGCLVEMIIAPGEENWKAAA